MKKLILSLAVIAVCLAPTAFAATAQQGKMTECNAQATGKKGDERKAFMKDCLSAKAPEPAVSPKTAQQQKMTTCNKNAGDKQLKGDERKAFMSDCLKKG